MEERDFRYFAVNEIANLYPHVNYDEHLDYQDVNCISQSNAMGNLSGLFTTRFNDGLIFLVTFNAGNRETKIETYRKIADNSYF